MLYVAHGPGHCEGEEGGLPPASILSYGLYAVWASATGTTRKGPGGAPVYIQAGSLARTGGGYVKGTEEPSSGLGMAKAQGPPKAEPRRGAGTHASSETRGPRGAKGLPRGRGLGCARPAERSPACAGRRGRRGRPAARGRHTHTLEADRKESLQGLTKEEGTFWGRRGRRGGKRHEELAKALVDFTTRLAMPPI